MFEVTMFDLIEKDGKPRARQARGEQSTAPERNSPAKEWCRHQDRKDHGSLAMMTTQASCQILIVHPILHSPLSYVDLMGMSRNTVIIARNAQE